MSTRLRSRRAIPLYLAAIVVPSLLLLFFAWQSIARQREAITALTASNRVLAAQRLVMDVESHLAALVSACLRDAAAARSALDTGESAQDVARTADPREQWHRLAQALVARHPVAAHFVVLRKGHVVYPAVHAPLAHPIAAPAAGETEHDPALRAFRARFEAAERLELAAQRFAEAAAAYQRCRTPRLPPDLDALALARIARCKGKAGRPAAGVSSWLALAGSYGDRRDATQQPYGLVAAVEVAGEPTARAAVDEAYRDLLAGRWALSADEVDYYLPILEAALGRSARTRPDSSFLRQQLVARALAARPVEAAGLEHGHLHVAVVRAERGDVYPLLLAPRTPGDDIVVGIVVNVPWLAATLLPTLSPPPGTRVATHALYEEGAGAHDTRAVDAALHLPLPMLLNAIELRVPTAPSPSGSERTNWIFAGSTALTLVVLVMGVLLLLRDVGREMETNRLRGELVNGVSHELKTPLTLIRMFAETLSADPPPGDADRRHFCGIMMRESDRLSRLIDRVLTFSRTERGQGAYHLVDADLGEVVRSTLDAYRYYLSTRGFTLREVQADDLPPVCLDTEAVSEALLNLLDNAVKYSGDAREIDVALLAVNGSVLVEVRDHGPGIEPDDQPRIFEAFWRAERRSGKGGYGLGLFLVRQIMRAHSGRVEVESRLGEGSTFRLLFPSASPAVSPEKEASETEFRGVEAAVWRKS